MVAEVLTSSRFGKNPNAPQPEAPEPPPAPKLFEDLDLAEPRYGEELLGTLTDEEAAMFVDYFNAQAEATALDREAHGSMLVNVGQDYRTGAFQNGVQSDKGYDFANGLDPELMRDFFRTIGHVAKLKGALFFDLGERFGCHDWVLGIRTKRRVYKVSRKWGNKP